MGERITFLGKLIPKLWNIFCRRILAREAILALKMNPKPVDMSSDPFTTFSTTIFKTKNPTSKTLFFRPYFRQRGCFGRLNLHQMV